MIPDDVVDRVRDEADIIAIVGEFVKLKRVGNSFRGPCPFHHGKNDNFSVSTKGGYTCFKCGEKGDVFTFAQKHLGLDFVEAVKWVGARAGVEVREVSKRTEERDPREAHWEVNASAAEFFRAQLWDAPSGKAARDYVASRGLSREDADRFSIGVAPKDSAAMRDALVALGFDAKRQIDAGLLIADEDRPEPRPRFRNRLMFPIYDPSGHVVGFGGRSLGDADPKYLNSSESQVFAKRTLLYGLNWAKQSIRKADRLIVVEGYFDAIRLMLAGIGEVVAPLGTALTEEQSALIRKYTKNVFLLYDSDQAGLKATFRSGDRLLAAGASVRVITLPDGEDPDTFVAKFGADAFERQANASVDVFDRKIQLLERGGWFSDLRRKRASLDKLMPTIRVTSDRLLQDLYVARTSDVAGVSREMLARELSAPSDKSDRRPPPAREPDDRDYPPPLDDAPPEPRTRQGDRRADRPQRGARAERELVRMLLHHRKYMEAAAERVGPENFADGRYRAIFIELTAHDADVGVDELAAALDESTTAVLQDLISETGGLDRVEETVEGSINAMVSRSIAARMSEIDRLLPLVESVEQDGLITEKRRLAAELNAMGRPRWKNFNSTSP